MVSFVFVELAGTTGVGTTPVFKAAGTTLLYTVGPLVFVVGILLVGGSIICRDDISRMIGGLLIIGTVVFALASIVADLAALLTLVGAAVTAAGFVWLGIALYATDNQTRRGEE